MAQSAYIEAINPLTPARRRDDIDAALLEYCSLHTHSMVKIWQYFTGRVDMAF